MAFELHEDLFGWHDRPDDVEKTVATMPLPLFGAAAAPLQDTGKGKVVLLYEAIRKVYGKDIILTQRRGVCVSKCYALCVDATKCVQILTGSREEFVNTTASEVIYAGSRIEVGQGGCGHQDGSVGAWAAKWVVQGGTLVRDKYGQWDLTRENDDIACLWGAPGHGVPDDLEPAAREHVMNTTSLITTVEQARDAIANGYPVGCCSNQGFSMTRDQDGFARPQGSWPHAMAWIAVDDASARPGFLVMNSWGNAWIQGPKRHNQPDGSFWIDYDVAARMLRGQDTFTMSGFHGYPRQRLDHLFL